ncbi:uncharacterized protein LOC131691147 [Topomyia yanbarensis]|uniref:uncharacterized protein LOC131691147 n=1 Tax=Topomyia yanbarensis TaxID=2498891 RepID=UPI00273C275C|nr:uncharacterized protein LOC131691147 [Topomyia yanbarensis]
MKNTEVPTVDITLNLDVNTYETCSRMVQTVIEVLLFQRNQIPFCFQVFRMIVKKISNGSEDNGEPSEWNNYQLNKQRETASKSLETVNQLFEELSTAIQQSRQKFQFLVLFGSTVYTAKEAFVINVPGINRNHYPQYHRNALEGSLNQLKMKLTLADNIHCKPKVTRPTNMFLLISAKTSESTQDTMKDNELNLDNGQLIEGYTLPSKCHKYVINLANANGTQLHCCKEMEVFRDLTLNLEIDDACVESLREARISESSEKSENYTRAMWYQIGNGFKGYKNVSVKGKSVWNYG